MLSGQPYVVVRRLMGNKEIGGEDMNFCREVFQEKLKMSEVRRKSNQCMEQQVNGNGSCI